MRVARTALALGAAIGAVAAFACTSTPEDAVVAATAETSSGAAPRSPMLADGLCALVHCDPYQSDSFPVRGSARASGSLREDEIDLLWGSPISGGVLDRTYPDGSTVFWVPKVDRIWKLGLDESLSLVELAELQLPPGEYPAHPAEFMQAFVDQLDALPLGDDAYREKAAYWRNYQLAALHAYYAALDRDGVLFVGGRDRIVAYADVEPGNPHSAIEKRGELIFDTAQMNGGPPLLIGLNATWDGTLVAVSLDGTLVAVDRDLTRAVYHRFPGERFWNSIAVDEAGGIYAVTDRRLHKIVWTGEAFSTRPEDGAWSEPYAVGEKDAALRGSRGSGTTPSLMGLEGDRDQFVVIADAADVNNLVLYWRDEIPEDWTPPEGAPSRRVAGMAAVDFGDAELEDSYSENSPVVLGHGAVVANNRPQNGMPLHLDNQLWINAAAVAPRGLQKFAWDPETRRFAQAWVRPELSVPSSTPAVSALDRQLHCVTVHDEVWALETLDWDTGATRGLYLLGRSQRFNPIAQSMQLMANGDPLFSVFGGVLHLAIGGTASPPTEEDESSP